MYPLLHNICNFNARAMVGHSLIGYLWFGPGILLNQPGYLSLGPQMSPSGHSDLPMPWSSHPTLTQVPLCPLLHLLLTVGSSSRGSLKFHSLCRPTQDH